MLQNGGVDVQIRETLLRKLAAEPLRTTPLPVTPLGEPQAAAGGVPGGVPGAPWGGSASRKPSLGVTEGQRGTLFRGDGRH